MLAEAGSEGIGRDLVSVHGLGAETEADWSNLGSPENYLGYERTQGFVSPGGTARGKHHVYVAPAQMNLNEWALSGDWRVEKEAIMLDNPNGGIVYRFHARDLHLVMRPSLPGTSVRFRVLIDGQALGKAHGTDVDGEGYGTVTEPRMYQLIRQQMPIIDRRFEIEFLGGGAEAFSFTFG